MSSRFDDFEARALALRHARARTAGTADDEELDALFASFLGPDYDRARVERVREERRRARRALSAIAAQLGTLGPEEVAERANREMTRSLARVRKILGDADFERLFGTEGLEPVTLVDPVALARASRSAAARFATKTAAKRAAKKVPPRRKKADPKPEARARKKPTR